MQLCSTFVVLCILLQEGLGRPSCKLGEAFDIREAAAKLSEDTLRRAKALHEAQGGVKASRLALMCAMTVYLHLVMV